MEESKYNELIAYLRKSEHPDSGIWYHAFSICGKDVLSWLNPSMWESFEDMFFRFHKGFRQADFNLNLVRLTDDHKKIQERLGGHMDSLIWHLIREDKGFLGDTLKELFINAEWKKSETTIEH